MSNRTFLQMKFRPQLVLIIAMCALLLPSYSKVNDAPVSAVATSKSSVDENLLCHEWTLVMTTVISEKAKYQEDGDIQFSLNCDSKTWTTSESKKVFANGTWSLNQATQEIEFNENGEVFVAKINSLTKNKFVITYSDMKAEYKR